MVIIAPSILSADFGDLRQQMKMIERAGAQWAHIDVMDGHFVPNITIGPVVIKSVRGGSGLFFDTHLMIQRPERYIKAFSDAGVDLISVHLEAETDVDKDIELILAEGKKAAIAINPDTPFKRAGEYMDRHGDKISLLLIMSVFPGFGGQKFIADVLPKIREARDYIDSAGLKTLIEVDGGINLENIGLILDAGVDVVVAGSAIFKSEDPEGTIRRMLSANNFKS